MSFWGFKRAILFASVLGIFFYTGMAVSFAQASVCLDSNCFFPELAQTSSQKQKGLMGRDHLPEMGGMLFIYDEEIQTAFWMKNMEIPLDFLWLDQYGKVVDLRQHVPVCGESCPSIISQYPSKYILEIASGTIEKLGITVGDQAIIQLGAT